MLLSTVTAGETSCCAMASTSPCIGPHHAHPDHASLLWSPFVFYLLLLARLVERLGTTEWGRLFVFAAACFGTFFSGFLASFNNHSVAATGALFALYQCLCIHLDDDRRSWRFVLAGLFGRLDDVNQLPAASLAARMMLWLLYLSPARPSDWRCPRCCCPWRRLSTHSILPWARSSRRMPASRVPVRGKLLEQPDRHQPC